ncbi:hypothetical protein PQX77_002894 [Marasmius sp. AFHP31]|nr:hypothetical protein PQX77_002894 [Marasmius sp. AFHP31]
MIMTLPLVIPSGAGSTLPPNALSPSSTDESSSGPRTPVSPTPKNLKKSSRRANTAERRATHNAVERARRETLNGRFLDLAKMLPNLSQIRRPSKSAIVNSSIAHIHASRRHRVLASRELRMMKLEADQLRHELNEWRDRAGISRVEEPVRGDGFSMVLNQELEVIPIVTSGGDDDEDGFYGDDGTGEEGGAIGVEEQQRMMMAAPPPPEPGMGGYPDYSHPQQQQQQQQRPPFVHHPQSLPMIATPGSFDGYTTEYHHPHHHQNLPYDKFPIQQQQQQPPPPPPYHQRRDRSNSMASMTSSGSASPPLPLYPQPFEAGWTTHPQSGGGIGNGVTFAMM